MDERNDLPRLSNEEIRVLGSLIEKSKTTPDYYPMTINAITAACNQKTSRKPVVDYDEATVQRAVNSLKSRSLVTTAVGGTMRAVKYKHNFTTVYSLSDAELAVMCLLFLRGPLTPGEINSNSGRIYEFQSLEEVYQNLEKLSNDGVPFIEELPRMAGQKESRFRHLFSDYQEIAQAQIHEDEENRYHTANLEERLAAVEKELAELKETVAKLHKEFTV